MHPIVRSGYAYTSACTDDQQTQGYTHIDRPHVSVACFNDRHAHSRTVSTHICTMLAAAAAVCRSCASHKRVCRLSSNSCSAMHACRRVLECSSHTWLLVCCSSLVPVCPCSSLSLSLSLSLPPSCLTRSVVPILLCQPWKHDSMHRWNAREDQYRQCR